MAPSLELGGIGGVERGGSDGPLSLMLVLGTLLGFQGIPLAVATVGRTRGKKPKKKKKTLPGLPGAEKGMGSSAPAAQTSPEANPRAAHPESPRCLPPS